MNFFGSNGARLSLGLGGHRTPAIQIKPLVTVADLLIA